VAARLDQCGRVEDHEPEPLARATEFARHVERVAAPQRDAGREPVALEIAARRGECCLRRIHREHRRGTTARGVQRPLALVREQVQHTLGFRP
jgi:hypothetical protein